MSYRASTPPMSKAAAGEFGKWLGLYAIQISGLTIWQIGASGRKYRDQALADTITVAIGEVTSGVMGGAAAAPMAAGCSVGCAPIAALLAPFAVPITIAGLLSLPLSWLGEYRHRKRSAETMHSIARNDPIIATEIHFGVTNVSDKRRQWTEHLIGIYARRHQWYDIHGFAFPAELTKDAMNYPAPWSRQPRRKSERKPSRQPGRVRSWLSDL